MNQPWKLYVVILIIFLSGYFVLAMEVKEEEKAFIIIPDQVSQSIKIDGDLNEEIWKSPSLNKPFITFEPNYGQVLSQETRIWAAYNRKDLFFAFKCYDTEPNKIKTSISQRDKMFRDDFIGVILDSMYNKQSAYEFYVNPNGIQGDISNSAVSGQDLAPDFVWKSAGKITREGYQVEIRIPLESIRFKKAKEVKMGIIFIRQISRTGNIGTWPEKEAGQTEFNAMAAITYEGLKKGLNLEILPNFTYSTDKEKQDDGDWGENETSQNIGIALKYGITSSITAEATIYPDFSQVESDVFQVEVNQRYPIFYSEKRPFFMEGMNVFDFSTIMDGLMIAPVHTRRILDPGWAAKLSGTAGKMNFAFLAANDRAPGREINKTALFGIARAKYNIGSDNSIGVLYSGRHFDDQKNDVLGLDFQYRPFKHLRTSISYLHSTTTESEGDPVKNGDGWNVMLQYHTPKIDLLTGYEYYGKDFAMATAFQKRIGINGGYIGIGPRFHIKSKKIKWFQMVQPFFRYATLNDLFTKINDSLRTIGVNMYLARQGWITLQYRNQKEAWAGELFNKRYFHSLGQIQLFKWLYLFELIFIGDEIYYHPTDPFLGNIKTFNLMVTLEPSIKLNVSFDYWYSSFKEKQTNQEIYTVNIYNLHTTYQFNKYFFLRGILRYDSYQEKLLTDLLASFTLIPGTVVHLGYGSLYLRNQWQGDRWVPGQGDLLKMKEGLFFKASYLWRIK